MEILAKILNSLKTLDRRIIFVVTALAVIIPLVTGLAIPSKKITKEVQGIYDTIEKLPPDSKILISFDYDPQTKPECHPMTTGIIIQCFRKNIKVVGIALWPMGASLGEEVLIEQSQKFNKQYGTDYAFLGYKSGNDVVIQKVCTNFRDTFPTDSKGLPLKDIPIMNGINRVSDFSAIFSISSGDPGLKQWTIIAHEQTGVPVGGGCTAVSAPEFYPYLNAGQMVGLLGGMQAAAEYEKLLGIDFAVDVDDKTVETVKKINDKLAVIDTYKGKKIPKMQFIDMLKTSGVKEEEIPAIIKKVSLRTGMASSGMGAQSVVHMVIILFIILANISYFYEKKKQKLGIE